MSVLKEIIENNSTPKGKLFDYFIQALIVLSLISLSIETLPDLSSSTREFLYKFEVACIIIFSIEYFLRVYVSDKPLNYIFSFYGVIDLIAIVPFFFPNPVDLRFLRIFRIFRIFRAY